MAETKMTFERELVKPPRWYNTDFLRSGEVAVRIGMHGDWQYDDFLSGMFLEAALRGDVLDPFEYRTPPGVALAAEMAPEDFLTLVRTTLPLENALENNETTVVAFGESGVVSISFYPKDDRRLHINGWLHEKAFEAMGQLVAQHTRPWVAQDPGGSQHILMRKTNNHGYQTRETRDIGLPFQRHHYMPDVAEAFDGLVRQLSAKEPAGRLLLIEGPPGTGKTHYCRSIFAASKEAVFLLVPSSLVNELTGPDLISALLDFEKSAEGADKRIVIVLEDADECVKERKPDDKNDKNGSVAALLELSDGLLGHVLDLRIIATTNTVIEHMDPAITRKGRLLRRLRIGPLDALAARHLYEKLANAPPPAAFAAGDATAGGMSLGDVFAAVHERRS